MSSHRRIAIVLAALSAAAITPAAASAAQRYASPSGAGATCTSAAPCDVLTAVNNAVAGDEVIVEPGDYQVTTSPATSAQISIHGVDGQPRPRIFISQAPDGFRLGHASSLRHVEIIELADTTALSVGGGSVEDVIAKGVGIGADTVEISGDARNCVFVEYGTNGRAVRTGVNGATVSATLRNVTAVAEGATGTAVQATALSPNGSATINLINVIAAAKPGGVSLSVDTDSTGATAKIVPTYSNFQGLGFQGSNAIINLGGAGNQGYDPSFVDPSIADYHEAAGSPTIDKGIDDPLNGQFDFDGGSRILGTTDIGADEYGSVPAPPGGGGGGDGSSDSGSGSAPDQPTGDSSGPVLPTAQTSTTAASKTAPFVPFAGVRLVSHKLTLSGKFVAIRLRCPAAAKGGCSGRTKLIARKRHAHSSRNVVLGQVRFSIAPGAQAKVRVHVSRANRRLLRRSPRLFGLTITDSQNTIGQIARSVDDVTLRHRRA